ncbi:MAG: hypothetical protein COB53_08515 [Elusimicrobia bacterium]|nr:MAG: hypothetical protein COB53_08515 [Elusimicrobiota bacterium]
MTRFLLSLALLIPMTAAAGNSRENTVRRRDPEPAKFWMVRYPIRQYASIATIEISVADFKRSYKQVRKFIKKFDGAEPSPIVRSPEDTVLYQQFSVVFERKKGERVLERLRRLGKVGRDTRQDIMNPEIPREAGTKLAQLEMERSAGKDNLRALSSIRAVLNELMGHLEKAVQAYEESEHKILLNIVLEQPKT